MKKLSIISEQIKNNTYSYTGKGSFESVVKNNKELVLRWLEELIPLQQQIDNLKDISGLEFQKRNYTRILTKLFPLEYTEFVSINILIRDSEIIAKYYDEEYNITLLYENLKNNKYLKYPGKYEKYVEFSIFQKFIMLYRDDLISSLDSTPQKNNTNIDKEIEAIDAITKETEEPKSPKEETNWTNLLLGKLK